MRAHLLLAAALLAAAPAALAQSGLSLGVRVGGAMPVGGTAASADLSDELSYAIPLTAELSLAVSPAVAIGPFVQYAFGALSTAAPLGSGGCVDTGSRCWQGHDVRAGAQVLWTIDRSDARATWIAFGTAYEWLGYSARDPTGSGTISYRGWEWLNLALGMDLYQLARGHFGPYASASVGRFERVRLAAPGETLTGEIADKKIHGWLQLGLRASFDL